MGANCTGFRYLLFEGTWFYVRSGKISESEAREHTRGFEIRPYRVKTTKTGMGGEHNEVPVVLEWEKEEGESLWINTDSLDRYQIVQITKDRYRRCQECKNR